jgi:predicted MFS family arabinose efflux permease
MPIGSWLGATLGWRAAYLLEASLALAAVLAVAATMPARVFSPGVSLSVWRRVGGDAALVLALAVTVAQTAGQFTLSSFLAPEYLRLLQASPAQIALLFMLFGACGFLGNVAAARLVGRLGVARTVALTLSAMLLGLAIWTAGTLTGIAALIVLALVPWGLGCFASNSLQQARVDRLAPALAPATVALNSSGLYVGQAIGALSGSTLLAHGVPDGLAPWGVVLMALALALSARVERAAGGRRAA